MTPHTLAALRQRVAQEGLRDVRIGLGEPGDPRLPPGSVDLALLVHMYHEIGQLYALLANLLPALRPGARVAIVDTTRPTEQYGTPPALLDCELAAVGYQRVATLPIEGGTEYLAMFEPPARAPASEGARGCALWRRLPRTATLDNSFRSDIDTGGFAIQRSTWPLA